MFLRMVGEHKPNTLHNIIHKPLATLQHNHRRRKKTIRGEGGMNPVAITITSPRQKIG